MTELITTDGMMTTLFDRDKNTGFITHVMSRAGAPTIIRVKVTSPTGESRQKEYPLVHGAQSPWSVADNLAMCLGAPVTSVQKRMDMEFAYPPYIPPIPPEERA